MWHCYTLLKLIFSAVASELLEEDGVVKAWAGPRKLGAGRSQWLCFGEQAWQPQVWWEGCRDPEQDGGQAWEVLSVQRKVEERAHLQVQTIKVRGNIQGKLLGHAEKNEGAVNSEGSKEARRGNFRVRARAELCESLFRKDTDPSLLPKYHTLAL